MTQLYIVYIIMLSFICTGLFEFAKRFKRITLSQYFAESKKTQRIKRVHSPKLLCFLLSKQKPNLKTLEAN